ncbi:hypothetical protein [Cytobacillus firmus]|uniref:hypothetical protein n=1 Tax=Cytobacillus firmus TaxID=1399 RepID=UPI0022280F76|nr:hypothetical protein [Cytobacillus firmus]
MVEDVKELAGRLTRLEDSQLDIMLEIAKGENHISVVPAAKPCIEICAEPIMTQGP